MQASRDPHCERSQSSTSPSWLMSMTTLEEMHACCSLGIPSHSSQKCCSTSSAVTMLKHARQPSKRGLPSGKSFIVAMQSLLSAAMAPRSSALFNSMVVSLMQLVFPPCASCLKLLQLQSERGRLLTWTQTERTIVVPTAQIKSALVWAEVEEGKILTLKPLSQ